jgi:peptidoglycan/xylan/chitin deacetylase (PgdA/CDA1 family)
MALRETAGSLIGRGLVASRLHRRMLTDRGIVVAFHRVNDEIPEDGITRSSRDFDRFCAFFRKHFDVITLTEFVSRLESGKSVAGTLAITLDDGYRGNFYNAAPILKKYGLPATFFVVTRYLGTSIIPWWDKDLPVQPGWMTWDEVRTLRKEGFEIGAHTRNHANLGEVNGAEAELEIRGSKEDLTRELGEDFSLFAYPYGQQNNLVEPNRDLVRAAGFRCCASCFGGLTVNGTDPFRLPRIPIAPWLRTPEQFAFEAVIGSA